MRNFALITGVALSPFASMPLGAKAPAGKPEGNTDREAIAARGADLMSMIDSAGDAGLMLTQEEGLDLINSGYAVVDTSVVDGSTAKVTLTDAGRAALASSGNSTTSYEIEDNIPIPTNTARRGRTGGYPFENLNIGQSFHVAAKAGEEPASVAARLQSSVSGARSRYSEDTGMTEQVNVKTYQKDAAGEFVKDENGKRVVASTTPETRPVTRPTRDFTVKPVGADDPKGAGARVWRVALDA